MFEMQKLFVSSFARDRSFKPINLFLFNLNKFRKKRLESINYNLRICFVTALRAMIYKLYKLQKASFENACLNCILNSILNSISRQ